MIYYNDFVRWLYFEQARRRIAACLSFVLCGPLAAAFPPSWVPFASAFRGGRSLIAAKHFLRRKVEGFILRISAQQQHMFASPSELLREHCKWYSPTLLKLYCTSIYPKEVCQISKVGMDFSKSILGSLTKKLPSKANCLSPLLRHYYFGSRTRAC